MLAAAQNAHERRKHYNGEEDANLLDHVDGFV